MDLYRSHVLVCAGAGCVSSNCKAVEEALVAEVHKLGLDKEVRIVETGCMGPCDLGPVMVVYPEGVFYKKLKPEDAVEIANEHLLKGRLVEHLTYKLPGTDEAVPSYADIDFFNKQYRIALRNCGQIDPLNVEEAIGRDAYAALGKALTKMTPADVIDTIKKSGLRGRGGGGFPTGTKWDFCAKAKGSPKYVVCNADEGDPGAFMDRSVMEGDPHSVIEAMAIGGYAIGANQGYVYIRAEYPLAVERLTHAIKQAREYGLLGKNIFGTGFDFDLDIRVGAGAFVCGEETALLTSIEGRRGEPRPRPPFPANEGLFRRPTVINNVETWACVSPIILKGADWFAAIGTEKSKGTKVFALAGKIVNTGLVEVPMGTPLGEIIFDIGGGIPNNKKFKAAQTGGPSGGCIPTEYLNTRVDYDTLTALGTIMGSGGLIIMDEDTCMVDLAKYFLEFVQDESCGKCTPCRIGTKRMLEILQRITRGQGKEGDIELLIEMSNEIKNSALCGLGQTAPNPVLSTIRYFRHEYEQHIKEHKCAASVCAMLFKSPCQNTCPANVDVPVYLDHIRNKRFGEAYLTVKEENPFPAICGRVCNHPCESKCRRAQIDEPLAIRSLKRFAGDWALQNNGHKPVKVEAKKGDKVAVIGSGPAGLSAAYYLAVKGYPVTVFEALPVAGGMMAVGIPEYRLPKKLLKSEIETIEKAGVEIKTGVRVGKEITLEGLRKKGYKAIFLAVGAHKSQRLDIPGEDLAGVFHATDFLRQVNLGEDVKMKGKKVAVIGGGNAAIDSARVALRLGAAAVKVVYRRRRDEMPALREEVDDAEHEGIEFLFLAAPKSVLGKDGRVIGLECLRMKLGEFDRSGRRRPMAVEGSEFVIDADVVIPAVSQAPEIEALNNGQKLEINRDGTVAVDGKMATKLPGVFAGGDCVTGPDTVIGAIAAGKTVASAIDKYLDGDGNVVPTSVVVRKISGEIVEDERPRSKMPCVGAKDRCKSFAEVELGFDEKAAVLEASRCLRCDVKE
ncbi:MAG TPA: NADH-quinone oxidoreductase subunit NuoF [Bacillota bacterium]|jgi:NADH-quinone oxidoreductase subunit F